MEVGDMEIISRTPQDNPFKATQIWEELIRGFRAGMPSRRQRLKLRFYDNCFTGAEALEWLQAHLEKTGAFGAVSQQQTQTLLHKFVTSSVIEEVRRENPREFKGDSSLYRFVTTPGPFNFVGDENTPLRSRGSGSISDTPLGKRKREIPLLDYEESNFFTNEFASTSYDEDTSSSEWRIAEEEEDYSINSSAHHHLGKPKVYDSAAMATLMAENESARANHHLGRPEVYGGGGGAMLTSPVKRRRSTVDRTGRSRSQGPSSKSLRRRVDMATVYGATTPPSKSLRRRVDKARKYSPPRESDANAIWKELTLNRLLSLVDLPSLDGVLNEDSLDGGHILHNVTSMARAVGGACSSAAQRCLMAVGGAGGHGPSLAPPASHVTRQHPSHLFGTFSTRLHEHTTPRESSPALSDPPHGGDLPQWVMLGLDCLSRWPEGCTEEFMGGMPIYGGFELDVYKSLLQYFSSLPRPLIPTFHFDLYVAVQKLLGRDHTHCMEALQLCLLLLPRASRVAAHRVLRFINKTTHNSHLRLSKNQSNGNLLLDQFAPLILRRSCKVGHRPEGDRGRGTVGGADESVKELVAYMVKEYHSIFKVPVNLEKEVKRRIEKLENGRGSPLEVSHAYCQQVSASQYEEQRTSDSAHHQWMSQLLEDILTNQKMSNKERKKKLKMFQKQYPEVYSEFYDKPDQLADSATTKLVGGASNRTGKPSYTRL